MNEVTSQSANPLVMEDSNAPERNGKELFPWHLGVFDAHCHPTDTIASQADIAKMKTKALTIMATRGEDQDLVKDLASHQEEQGSRASHGNEYDTSPKCRVVPSFGWHPWFSHQVFDDITPDIQTREEPDQIQHYRSVLTPSPDDDFISSLPKPRSLSGLLTQVRGNLESYASALVGEIGIDRSFRLPEHWGHEEEAQRSGNLTPGAREGRRLTPYRVGTDHQKKILKAQLNLAGEMGIPVSVHGVAAHGVMLELIKETWRGHEIKIISKRERKRKSKPGTAPNAGDEMNVSNYRRQPRGSGPKPYPPRICLHSYSGPLNVLEQYLNPSIPAAMFFSFSCLINFSSRTSKAVQVIKEVPDDKILVESDLHSAGEGMDQLLEDAVRSVCEIKGWSLVEGVTQLGGNWRRLVFGEDGTRPKQT